jgi:exonuclease SbcC
MKLHHLTLQAFGPFAGRQDIDFDTLNTSGLFLLEGPTGSGKSTVLDAITFALYAGLAGSKAGKDRLHSDHAEVGIEPFVELEFSVRGRRWKVYRVPAHERPARRGSKMVQDGGSVHLTRREGETWVSVSSSHSEVGDIIGDELGLTKEQFTQVVLLPQGEFATFLQANDDERRKVLTKIFGTWLYDAVTSRLEEQRRDLQRRVGEARQEVQQAIAVALEAAGETIEGTDDLMDGSADDRAALLDGVAQSLEERLVQARAAEADTHDDLLGKQEQFKRADEIAKRLRAFTQATQALAEHEATRDVITRVLGELDAAQRAVPVEPLLDQLDQLRANVDLAEEAVRQHPAALVEKVVRDGSEQSEEYARQHDTEAAALGHLVDLEAGLAAREQSLAELRADAEQLAIAMGERETEVRAVPGRIAALDQELAEARARAGGLAEAIAHVDTLTQQVEAARAAELLRPDVSAAQGRATAAEEARRRLVDAHQELLQRRLDGMAAELAGDLKPGDACPVCGSTEHPELAQAGDGAVSLDEVNEAARQRSSAEQDEQQAREHLTAVEKEFNEYLVAAGGKDSETLTAELEQERHRAAECRRSEQSVTRLETERTGLEKERESGERKLTEHRQRLAAAQAGLEEGTKRLETDTVKVNDARDGHETVAARQMALRESARVLRRVVKDVDSRDDAVAAASGASEHVVSQAAKAGFHAVAEARGALRTAGERAGLQEVIRQWHDELARLKADAERDEYEGLNPGQADQAQEDVQSARAAWSEADQAWKAARDLRTLVENQRHRYGPHRSQVTQDEAALTRARAALAPVRRLAALANGTEGHRRMTLTTYVLREWFVRVVEAANLRLDRMSSGRYHLERVEQGTRKDDRVGLGLHIVDRYTGKSRSTTSMSGGETFYTSLALALGLADVVRAEAGGVELDTMFIDEGFGSLDQERLEEVMGVIDELRNGNRTVGIVSHVTELKERVPERVEVRRSSDVGPSEIKVVA